MSNQDVCEIKPVKAFLSTNLNNKTKTFKDLADRIMRSLGYPIVSVELHRDMVFEFISIAIEFFSKYVQDREILLFDSRIYEKGKGINIGKLCTIASKAAAQEGHVRPENLFNKTYDKTIERLERVYIALRDIPAEELPSTWGRPVKNCEVITAEQYDEITTYNSSLCGFFKISKKQDFTIEGEKVDNVPTEFANAFDYDLMDYRRCAQVISYDESSNRSPYSLFSIQSVLSAQAFYSYQFSNRGFDLLSFHCLQEFLKTRRRVLALDRSFYFNPETQYFTILPEPRYTDSFYAVLQVYLEKPLREILREMWVYKYSLAQAKVALGSIRGKFGSVALTGGGQLTDGLGLRAEGQREIEELEKELIDRNAFGVKENPLFFVG